VNEAERAAATTASALATVSSADFATSKPCMKGVIETLMGPGIAKYVPPSWCL